MSSLVRRMQKRLLAKAKILPVPVFNSNEKIIGYRDRICSLHIGYGWNGTARFAPVAKPKRARKPKASTDDTKPARKPRAKKAVSAQQAAA